MISKKKRLMFGAIKELDKFKTIVVTGCHRSGTRFVSKVIAHELNRRFIGEEEVGYKRSTMAIKEVRKGFTVLHGPGLFHFLQDFNQDDTVFVFVNRPSDEIIKSNKTTGVAECKYTPEDRKKEWLALSLKNKTEFNYHDFEDHPLWVPQQERDFKRMANPGRSNWRGLLHETEWGKNA